MNVIKGKKKFRLWTIIKTILLAAVAVAVLWVIYSKIMTAYEQRKYPAIGEFVEVDGKKMHVYTKGQGDNTIVLLSGLATPAPALDFEPLINELSKTNQVVVVEPFGYGWSDLTDKERTVKNIVEETRAALEKSNIQGPYLLMPHSVSGIYSLYYATHYPEEVKAIIGIDPTLPQMAEYFGDDVFPAMPKFLGYMGPTGIARLLAYVTPENILPLAEKDTYTEVNLKIAKSIAAAKYINKTVVNETNEIKNNFDLTTNMAFPSDLPVMIFTPEEQFVEGKSKIDFYDAQLQNIKTNKLVVLEGQHYLHWTHYKEMSENLNEFVEGLK
ncbi:alpha/beta hydrolase [Solibacillus sp. FSL R5-0691]|uniref:alpha/beta fold hydrolase n=2 Tax=unclassified Solibacillus TaxID=2637870 RepID=UPI0030D169B2